MSAAQLVYLIKSDDPSLLGQSVIRLIDELVGDRDKGLVVQEIPVDADVSSILDACLTPAFLTDRRVVVVRDVGRFKTAEVEPLVEYLASPMPTTSLVLVGGGGALPTRLTKAVKEYGHVVDASAPSGKMRKAWVAERLGEAAIRVNRLGVDMIIDRLGDELGQLDGVIDALTSAFGPGAELGPAEIEPYLTTNGISAPWELTDAIDNGDVATALVQLRRMMEGGRHPLVIMSILQRHFGLLLRVDGSGISSEAEAVALLGVSAFPAKKAMAQARRLGTAPILRAIDLLAEADVDLRGASAMPDQLIMEVLVARLSKLQTVKNAATKRVSA